MRKFSAAYIICVGTNFSLLGAAQNAHGQEVQGKIMDPVDMVEIARISDPALSPDGKTIAYLQDEVNWEKNRKRDILVLRDVESGNKLPTIEVSQSSEDADEVVWSPDSTSFLTLRRRKGDEGDEVYQYSPASQKLTRLTDHPATIRNVQWGYDGEGFFFESNNLKQTEAKDEWSAKDYDYRPYDELFYYNISTNKYQRLLTGEIVISSYTVSRSADKLIVSMRNSLPKNDKESDELWLVDISGKIQQLTRNSYKESDAKLSPDNTRFAFIATVNEKGEGYYEDNLFLQSVGSEKAELLFPEKAMEVLGFQWNKKGDGIYVKGNIGLTSQLFHYDIATKNLRQITDGEHEIRDWHYSSQNDTHVASIANSENPGDVYKIDSQSGDLTNLSQEFLNYRGKYALPRQEAVQWKAKDGKVVEGLLIYPVGYEGQKRFPLVTISHGGPRSSVNFGSWNVGRYTPVLAGQGYGIFLPNYRGGTGYGDEFIRDMEGNYFNNSDDDVLSGIDALIDRGLADPDKLIAMGWSAGGHMTNWLIGQTDRFKAASSGAGVADWVSMYGESDFRTTRRFHFGGSPWQKDAPYEVFRKTSPITYAWKAKTPTLFFSGAKDERVPPTQGIIMYRALQDLGVKTYLYLLDGEPHNFSKPRNQLFKINRELQWYAEHLGKPSYRAVLPKTEG